MAEEQRMVAIYGLICPTTGKMRYVGKSQDPESRFKHHLYIARSNKYHRNMHIYRWLRKLHQQRLKPKLVIIERVTEDTWVERECYWIAHYGLDNLCNTKAGGAGGFPLVNGQSKRTQTSKIWKTTLKKLRLVSMLTGENMTSILDHLVTAELKRTQTGIDEGETEDE